MSKVSVTTVRSKVGQGRKSHSTVRCVVSSTLISKWRYFHYANLPLIYCSTADVTKAPVFLDISINIVPCPLQKAKRNTLCKLFYDWALNIPSKGQRKSHSSLHETEISSKDIWENIFKDDSEPCTTVLNYSIK